MVNVGEGVCGTWKGIVNVGEGVCDVWKGMVNVGEGVCDVWKDMVNVGKGVCDAWKDMVNVGEGDCGVWKGMVNVGEGVCDAWKDMVNVGEGVCDVWKDMVNVGEFKLIGRRGTPALRAAETDFAINNIFHPQKNSSMSAGDWKQLFQAAGSGDVSMVEYYLREGIDPNYQHPEFLSTPLIESAQNGHVEVVTLLLHYGADPHIKSDLDGLTALETARLHKQDKVAEVLMSYKGAK